MEQTDYSAYEPMSNKRYDTNDNLRQPENRAQGRKPVTDINYEKEDRKPIEYKNAKQSM